MTSWRQPLQASSAWRGDRAEIPCSRRSPRSLAPASVVMVHYAVARDLPVPVSRQPFVMIMAIWART